MDYRIVANDQYEMLRHFGQIQGDGFPYPVYPESLPRHRIALDGNAEMPKTVERLIERSASSLRLTRKQVQQHLPLARWLGHSVKDGTDIWWHQFGGEPWLIQGGERISCPNRKCSYSRRGWPMKVLAAIQNDPPGGLPMIETMQEVKENKGHFNHWVQVVFHICRGCWTIHAANRCD